MLEVFHQEWGVARIVTRGHGLEGPARKIFVKRMFVYSNPGAQPEHFINLESRKKYCGILSSGLFFVFIMQLYLVISFFVLPFNSDQSTTHLKRYKIELIIIEKYKINAHLSDNKSYDVINRAGNP